jgi:hypothetical protein
LKSSLRRLVYSPLSQVARFAADDAMLIVASPRGGSTWLTEMVASLPSSSILWGPLYLRAMPGFQNLGFSWLQPIPEDTPWPEARDEFARVLSGRVLNKWLLCQTRWGRHLRAEQLVVKFCRAHLLLPWLVRQFQFRRKPLVMVRHPLAVLASQQRHGAWDANPEQLNLPPGPFAAYWDRWRDVVADLHGRDETLLGWWCIAHHHLLKATPTERGWHLVAYEDVVLDPGSILRGLENSWHLRFPDTVHAQARQPSATTMDGAALGDPLAQLCKWQDSFSDTKLHRYQDILERFEISAYDIHSALPASLERDFHGQ